MPSSSIRGVKGTHNARGGDKTIESKYNSNICGNVFVCYIHCGG
jgi:hypothetical protein